MSTTISNQASITYEYNGLSGTAVSNIATVTLLDPLTVGKTALGDTYTAGEEITYILTTNNTGSAALNNIEIEDNLGTYSCKGMNPVTPLTYTGPAFLYINGVFTASLTPEICSDCVVFTIPSLPANSNAIIVYKAETNEFAPLTKDSTITNVAIWSTAGLNGELTASETIKVEEYADVTIQKDMSPDPVQENSSLTYTFTLNNYGNTEADNVVLSDVFNNPIPRNLTVCVNGAPVPPGYFSYNNGVFIVPSLNSPPLKIPAAKIVQDENTCAVSIIPGITTVVVTGRI